MEDKKIIELFWARNEDAIAETDATYGRKLRALANKILNNWEDAEESVSDTYMKTWEIIPPQRPTYFYAFIASICRHLSFHKVDWKQAANRESSECLSGKSAQGSQIDFSAALLARGYHCRNRCKVWNDRK